MPFGAVVSAAWRWILAQLGEMCMESSLEGLGAAFCIVAVLDGFAWRMGGRLRMARLACGEPLLASLYACTLLAALRCAVWSASLYLNDVIYSASEPRVAAAAAPPSIADLASEREDRLRRAPCDGPALHSSLGWVLGCEILLLCVQLGSVSSRICARCVRRA